MDLKAIVRLCLADNDRWEARRIAVRESMRQQGYRLVQHDQEGRNLVLRDAITGELLYRGDFDGGMALFDGTPPLADVDTIDRDGAPMDDTPVPDLLQGLLSTIRDWVDNNVQEAREYAKPGVS